MARGHKAGVNGESVLLSHITTHLTDDVFKHKAWVKAGEPVGCVVESMPFSCIYEDPARLKNKTEFMLVDLFGKRTRVESKWQGGPGSVDEKFPYLLLNVEYRWPENTVIIVTGGGGFRARAVPWLVENAAIVAGRTGKDITVMTTFDEFGTWCYREGKTARWRS